MVVMKTCDTSTVRSDNAAEKMVMRVRKWQIKGGHEEIERHPGYLWPEPPSCASSPVTAGPSR